MFGVVIGSEEFETIDTLDTLFKILKRAYFFPV